MAEELLLGLGAGRNGTKGGAALDKVDAGRLPRNDLFQPTSKSRGRNGSPSRLDDWTGGWLLD